MIKNNNWSSYRSTNLLVGFIVSISICLMAFNYTSYSESTRPDYIVEAADEDSMEVIRTPRKKQEQKVIPLPKKLEIKDIIEPIDDVVIAEPELIPVDIDDNNDIVVDSSLFKIDNTVINNDLPPRAEPQTDLSQTEVDETPFRIVEDMAYYGSCNDTEVSKIDKKTCSDIAFFDYLKTNINYPDIAHKNGIEGTVYIEILIGKDGKLESSKIARDIGGGCGEEALRVVNAMKDWSPAKQRGRRVRLIMTLPVKFALQ